MEMMCCCRPVIEAAIPPVYPQPPAPIVVPPLPLPAPPPPYVFQVFLIIACFARSDMMTTSGQKDVWINEEAGVKGRGGPLIKISAVCV